MPNLVQLQKILLRSKF